MTIPPSIPRAAIGAMLLTALAAASALADSVDVRSRGPRVGQRLPAFTATDQNGRSHTLASLIGSNGAMIVFFRSADW